MTKFVFITGGVVSSLGKGIVTSSLGAILKSRGLNLTLVKLDPYINVDPGTMNPYEHGEVYVTDDGAETDLDLGHYERFVQIKMTKNNNFTAGQIYESIISKERKGEFLGRTVQVIPHVTNEIKHKIHLAANGTDVTLVEIGGTVGDIESLPFLEAIRQMHIEIGHHNTVFIHLTLIPYLQSTGEMKTKPTQHSVKELRTIGIQPDILVCRSAFAISDSAKAKIALYSNIEKNSVISLEDVNSIYQVPLILHEQHLDTLVTSKLQLKVKECQLNSWKEIIHIQQHPKYTVNIGIVGKYIELSDAYKSLYEALTHAGIRTQTAVNVQWIDAEKNEVNLENLLNEVDAILVPGGFGKRGFIGKLKACEYARTHNKPFLGICLGMQMAVIEFARNCAKLQNANSTEFDPNTPYPVIGLIEEWMNAFGEKVDAKKNYNMGGSMRLGAQPCKLVQNSLAYTIYKEDVISERHRHRYEVNDTLITLLGSHGLVVSGRSALGNLVEVIELKSHPWFIGCQFHPEFNSNPHTGHVLFTSFIEAALKNKRF